MRWHREILRGGLHPRSRGLHPAGTRRGNAGPVGIHRCLDDHAGRVLKHRVLENNAARDVVRRYELHHGLTPMRGAIPG